MYYFLDYTLQVHKSEFWFSGYKCSLPCRNNCSSVLLTPIGNHSRSSFSQHTRANHFTINFPALSPDSPMMTEHAPRSLADRMCHRQWWDISSVSRTICASRVVSSVASINRDFSRCLQSSWGVSGSQGRQLDHSGSHNLSVTFATV